MDVIKVVILLLPGFMIFYALINKGVNVEDKPDYVLLAACLAASIPLDVVFAWGYGLLTKQDTSIDWLYQQLSRLDVLFCFVVYCLFAMLVIPKAYDFLKLRILRPLSKEYSKGHMYNTHLRNIWEYVEEILMYEHERLFVKVQYGDAEPLFGELNLGRMYGEKTLLLKYCDVVEQHILLHDDPAEEYSLPSLGKYVDMEAKCVIEIFDGSNC